MKSINLPAISRSVGRTMARYSPEILMGLGIAGMVVSTVTAVKATPKAMKIIESLSEEKEEKLTKTEVVKTTWQLYLPSVITGALSIACLIGSNSINVRRNAALAAAYTLSESALKEYKGKVLETIGEKKEKEIVDAIAQDRVNANPVSKNEVIFTGSGDTLCYDPIGGRYFHSDRTKIERAEIEINRRLLVEDYISLNEFYYELGLEGTEKGELLGWNVNDGKFETRFSSRLSDSGTPCLVLMFDVGPKYKYDR